jgi:hypothetical protein
MKTVLPAIRALLVANAGVTAIAGQRVFFNALPQDQPLPNIVIYVIASTPTETLAAAIGPESQRVQITCRALSFAQVDDLGAAVHACLKDYVGTSSGMSIMRSRPIMDVLQYDEATKVHRRIIDYRVSYRPA